MTKRLEKLH